LLGEIEFLPSSLGDDVDKTRDYIKEKLKIYKVNYHIKQTLTM